MDDKMTPGRAIELLKYPALMLTADAQAIIALIRQQEAEGAAYRRALEKVEKFFATEGSWINPIFSFWDNGDIGCFETCEYTFDESINMIRDGKLPSVDSGLGKDGIKIVLMYFEIYQLLSATAGTSLLSRLAAAEDVARAAKRYYKMQRTVMSMWAGSSESLKQERVEAADALDAALAKYEEAKR